MNHGALMTRRRLAIGIRTFRTLRERNCDYCCW